MTEIFLRKVMCDECGVNCSETSRSGFVLQLTAIKADDAPRGMSSQNPFNGDTLHFCNHQCLINWILRRTGVGEKSNT